MHCDLLIVGAGPAGLAHAFWRRQVDPHLDVRVIEAAPVPGGHVQTDRVDGYTCERGPQALRPSAATTSLCDALGITNRIVPADPTASMRAIARDGRLQALPAGSRSLLRSSILGWRGKLRLAAEPWIPRGLDPQESVAAFAGRRFGAQTVPLAEALASGVFAGDAHALEIAAAFPQVHALEQRHGSILRGLRQTRRDRRHERGDGRARREETVSFAGGMHALIEALVAPLGDRIEFGRAALGLRLDAGTWRVATACGESISTDELVLALPADRAAPLLAPLDAVLASELAAIRFASVASIHLGFPLAQAHAPSSPALAGFGFLLDRGEGSPMLGAIYCSSLFPAHAPPGHELVRVIAGGVLHSETVHADPVHLSRSAETMLRRYTGLTAPCVFRRTTVVHDAIPQFDRGHRMRVARIRERSARLPGLNLIGNSYDEVSLAGCLRPPGSC